MKHRAFNLLVLLSTLLWIVGCGERPVPAKAVPKRISRLVEFYDKSGQFSGTILVAQDGKIIYQDAFGWANREWRIPNTVDTKYRIASITKHFTAVLVMQQVERGRLQLAGKVSDYLPDYPEQYGDRITIHHLLTHRAGIIDYQGVFENFVLGGTADIGGFTIGRIHVTRSCHIIRIELSRVGSAAAIWGFRRAICRGIVQMERTDAHTSTS